MEMCTTRSDLFGWAGRKQVSCPPSSPHRRTHKKRMFPILFLLCSLPLDSPIQAFIYTIPVLHRTALYAGSPKPAPERLSLLHRRNIVIPFTLYKNFVLNICNVVSMCHIIAYLLHIVNYFLNFLFLYYCIKSALLLQKDAVCQEQCYQNSFSQITVRTAPLFYHAHTEHTINVV